MAATLRSAIALPFVWTSVPVDIKFAFSAGASPVNINVASATYYIQLATAATDYLRVVEAAINAAMIAAGRSETFLVTMTAAGLVSIACSGGGGTFSCPVTFGGLVPLGFTTVFGAAITATSNVQPKHIAFFTSRVSNGWVPSTAMAGAETLQGIGYGVNTGIYCESDDIAFDWIPPDPTVRTSLAVNQTPWAPTLGLTIGDHAGQWSVRDILANAQGKTAHVALGNLQALLASTTEPYDLVTLPTSELAAPRKDRTREGWDSYFRWTARCLRQSTQTGTRA